MAKVTKYRTSPLRHDTLLASVTVLLVVNLLQRSVGFGRGILFGRWLDPGDLGLWDMSYGFLLLAAPVVVLGLPGSFGRYLERFRQRGQLRTFMVRTTLWTVSLTALAVASIITFRGFFAWFAFGDSSETSLIVLVAIVLAAVILHHFLEAVFAGLRVFRVVSTMQFVQSMLFAALSLTLLWVWRTDAWSIVAAYGTACVFSAAAALVWAQRVDWKAVEETEADSHRAFWPPLLRFAVWVWAANLLSNLFALIDRWMIVHCSGLSDVESRIWVGNYHISMLVPMILVSVANLLVGAITPHLSHDWETGKREAVSSQLRLTLKFGAVGMFAMGIGVLLFTPTLFHLAFGGKYDEGLHVLPWALASCVWFSLLLVAQTYVWCAEKTRHATIPLAIGLGGNVVLILLMLPSMGLEGVVISTALATMGSLFAQLVVNWRLDMQLDRGSLLIVLLPFGLSQGTAVAMVSGVVIAFVCVFTPWIFSTEERENIVRVARDRVGRWIPGMRSPLAREA
jgi:PST family polysaccharide transporter